MEKEYKPTARQNMASEGVLNEQYTLDSWFVKIKPAYGIDRVNFSFVEKGKNGKGFNVYVNIDTFYNWMEDVQNFRLYKTLKLKKKKIQNILNIINLLPEPMAKNPLVLRLQQ